MAEQAPPPKRAAIVKTGKAALAVAAPEAAVPIAAAETVKGVLTGDIVVVRTVRNIGTKRNPVWQEKETHYNPVAIGIGAVAIGIAGFIGVTAWEGRGGGLWFGSAPRLKDNYDRFLVAHPKLMERLKLNRPG